jgi:hypothetical protein
MIPAKIEVTSVCALANSTPGIEFNNSETTQSFNQILGSFGRLSFLNLRNINKVNAPSAHLPKATPNGVKKLNPCLINKKEQPQTKPNAR